MTGFLYGHKGGSAGFTLLEVLVATAVTGIALGVLMSTIAQGHRQAFRGDMERQAGMIAERVMQHVGSGNDLETGSGDVDGHPGWKYRVELREPDMKISDSEGTVMKIDIEGFSELVVTVIPPGEGRQFSVSRLVKAEGE